MAALLATRFNNETWQQNVRWHILNNYSEMYYGFPIHVTLSIPIKSKFFLFEMNNNTNKIIGISLVKNKRLMQGSYNIYDDKNYNRFVYKTKYRVDREELNEEEEEFVKKMDLILFKGKSHLKRGQGATVIPDKLLIKTECNNLQKVKEIFKRKFKS